VDVRGEGDEAKATWEMVSKELMVMASESSDKFADAIIQLERFGLLKYILPEVAKMTEYEHSPETHPEGLYVRRIIREMRLGPLEPFDPNNPEHRDGTKYVITKEDGNPIADQSNPMSDVFDHTMAALKTSKIKDPVINLAILLHDVGKPISRDYKNGRVNYFLHAKKGADLVKEIGMRVFKGVKKQKKMVEAFIFAIQNHMKGHDPKLSNAKIAQLMKDENWEVLLHVMYADNAARGELFKKDEWKEFLKKVEQIQKTYKNKEKFRALRKVVNGDLVKKLKGINPGPDVGKVIQATMDWILNNRVDISTPIGLNKMKKFMKDFEL